MVRRTILLVCLAGLALSSRGWSENWPQWRGPSFNGSSPDKGFPETWGPNENLAWKTALPGSSGATPIVWDTHVYLTACEQPTQKLWALCLDRGNGQILWQKECGQGFDPKRENNGASPSAVTDGQTVVFTFGTGRMMAFTPEGESLWDLDLVQKYGPFEVKFGYSCSPLLYDGKLYVQVLHGWRPDESSTAPVPDSYLLCLDLKTGQEIWRHVRTTDAPWEARDSYSTPHLFQTKKVCQIVVNGGDYVTGHDPATGQEIWRSDNVNKRKSGLYRTICSTSQVAGILICPVARGDALFALTENVTGQLKEEDRAWSVKDFGPDVCTPLAYDKKLFVLDGGRKVLTCRDAMTGTILSRCTIPGKSPLFASPTGADGKIYCIDLEGECFVYSADKELKELARIPMGDKASGSSIVASEGQLFIRTYGALTCVGKRKD